MQTATIQGGYCDVTFHLGDLYVARMADAVFVDRWDGTTFVPVANFPCGGNGFPRLKSVDGSLWLEYRPQNGQEIHVKNLSDGTSRVYAGVFYNWPTALGEVGYAVNSFGTGVCEIYHYDGELAQTMPALPGTGVAYLTGFNNPVSVDDNRGSVPGMYNPERTDGLVCGEGPEGGVACLYQDTITKTFNQFTEAFVPKITKHPSQELWAIVSNSFASGLVTLYYDITAADFGETPEPPDPPDPGPEPPVPPVDPTNVVIRVKAGETKTITVTIIGV